MKYRKLGSTGIEVSEIGFGAWGIGGLSNGATSYGETDDNESKRSLRRAYDLGITFYDTSNLYGYGHSEELIGEELHDVRDKIKIASKVGFLEHRGPQDFSEAYVRESIEGTLKRLRTDYLDLYQLHSPDIELLRAQPDLIETFRTLQKEGKLKAFGISIRHPNDGLIAINDLGFGVIQVNFNMIDQRALENGLFKLAAQKDVGIIARTPLAFGFLTGAIKDTKFNERDHRSVWSEAQLKRWVEAPDMFTFINRDKDRTPCQLALKFCLGFPAVATVIPGMLHPSEVEENAAAADKEPLSEEELSNVELVYRQHTFFEK